MGDRTFTPDPDDPIDCAALEFQQGVQRAENFDRIVTRYYKPVQAFLSKRGLSADVCDDLNQEVFLKVYTGLDRYAWKAKFASWVFTIAVNTYRNWRSSELRHGILVPLAPNPDPPSHDVRAAERGQEGTSLKELISQEQEALLRAAVSELPPKMRECVRLLLEGYSYQAIADELGLAIGTVKAHLHEARKRLQKTLGKYFDNIDF